MPSGYMPLLQGYTHKLAPKWLSPFIFYEFTSPVAYHMDLPPMEDHARHFRINIKMVLFWFPSLPLK